MKDCLFCKIVAGDIPAKKVYEDEQVIAFNDINPQAPSHVLIVPKKHISTLNDLTYADSALVGHMAATAAKLAKDLDHADNGYRVVMNCNDDGGQTVFHIHLHLLAGRSLKWPPG